MVLSLGGIVTGYSPCPQAFLYPQASLFSPKDLLTDETWRDMIQSTVYMENVVGFVVDEAHCVKKW